MSSKTVNIRYGLFMLIAAVMGQLSYLLTGFTDSVQIVMLLVCVVWFNTIKYRVIIPALRHLLCGMSVMLSMLFLLTIGKYTVFSWAPLICRYLNYMYQIPVLVCALLSFYSALCIGVADTSTVLKKWNWMSPLCAAVILGYLTNDMHHLAYRTIEENGDVYGHYIVCYISWAFQFFVLTAAFFIILRRSRISNINRFIWLPIIILVAGTVLLFMIVINGNIMMGRLKIGFQTVYASMMIGFWESCTIIGLVPSNSQYFMLVDSLPINVQITDSSGELRFDSASFPITAEQRISAISSPVMVRENILLKSRDIPGGHAFWTEDRNRIETLNAELRESVEFLHQRNEILRQESTVKEEKARYEVQNNTYNRLAEILEPTVDKINVHLNNDDLAQACVLGTYIKRRANLFLLNEQSDKTDISELYHSVRESLDSLKLLGITCSVYTEGSGKVPSKAILDAYDFFEHITEENIASVTAVMVLLGRRDSEVVITVNISGDGIDDDAGCFIGTFGGGERHEI
ncbi:MAG: hypothetical protein ILP19_04350 [Oscillospiraceae bacterium]|nr:hypothetical protein [Oscillospiraceae bacterium]